MAISVCAYLFGNPLSAALTSPFKGGHFRTLLFVGAVREGDLLYTSSVTALPCHHLLKGKA